MLSNHGKFNRAIKSIDAHNADDPRNEIFEGILYPQEILYSKRMTEWLGRLYPDASEALQLAVRGQHIRRWTIPRKDYPAGRRGYHHWRNQLKQIHATITGKILRNTGYSEDIIHRVQALIRKERLKDDPEAQALEDTACLVFLENYFNDFSKQIDEEKLVQIIRKTWRKMSVLAQNAALKLKLTPQMKSIIERALRY